MVKIIEPKIITDELKPDGSYGRFIEEPLDTALLEGDAEEKALAVAAFYTEANERMVRRAPDQWFWMHNRWKTKRVMDD